MTEQFLEDYFAGIATASVHIGHTDTTPAFYRMKDALDLDEFDNAVRNMVKTTCLLLEIGEGSIGEFDNQYDSPNIGLHLLIKTTDAYSDVHAARDQAKAILNTIISRMRLDCKGKHERSDQLDGPLRAQNVVFDTRVKFSNMSDVDGNWYGKSIYFFLRSPLNLVYDTNDWM